MKTHVGQDLLQAVRAFKASPGLAVAAILSLAIGIGANTAIFSVANALLLRPLDYRDADRLAILWNRSPGLNIEEDYLVAVTDDIEPNSWFDPRVLEQLSLGATRVTIAIGEAKVQDLRIGGESRTAELGTPGLWGRLGEGGVADWKWREGVSPKPPRTEGGLPGPSRPMSSGPAPKRAGRS